jgi:uncharacterized protein YkwD
VWEAKQNFAFVSHLKDAMLRALIVSLGLLLAAPGTTPPKAALKQTVSRTSRPADSVSSYSSAPSYDYDAERELLEMANQARAQAGVPPLQVDSGLTQAARAHAAAMARERQLSHQLDGEPPLLQRVSVTSDVRMDRAGENVALDSNVEDAEKHLLLSPPHRENLLNPAFNIAGFAVVRQRGQLYVVQDFGHSVASYTPDQSEDLVAAAVEQMRAKANLPPMQRVIGVLQNAACSMAQENKLNPRPIRDLSERFGVFSYNDVQPQNLPASASRFITDRHLRNFSVGSCYSRKNNESGGLYWVVLIFY